MWPAGPPQALLWGHSSSVHKGPHGKTYQLSIQLLHDVRAKGSSGKLSSGLSFPDQTALLFYGYAWDWMAQRSFTKRAMLINNFQACILVKGSEGLGSVSWDPESSYKASRIYWFTHPLNIYWVVSTNWYCVNAVVQCLAKLTPASRTSHKRKNVTIKGSQTDNNTLCDAPGKDSPRCCLPWNISSTRVLWGLFPT